MDKIPKGNNMETRSFYINRDYVNHVKLNEQKNETVPIRINCTGYENRTQPFVTKGERLDWYIQLVDKGSIKSQCGDIQKCQFIVWPPNVNHHYEKENSEQLGYYWVHFTGSYAQMLLEENGIEPLKVYTVSEELLKTLRREWGFLFREYMLRRPNYDIMVASLLISIIVRLGRQIKKNSPEALEGDLRKRLEHTVSYIHNHFTENLSIKELSEIEHLSESRFREVFKKAFGVSPGEYIINLRIDRAGELLLTSDLHISNISKLCGYSDELYFSRIFKKKMGVSPIVYRREGWVIKE